ncbi:MAG: ATP-binding protein [candidate division WOR-3 bacterium]
MEGRVIRLPEKINIFFYLLIFLTIIFFLISLSSVLKAVKDLEKLELEHSKERLEQYFENRKEALRHQVLELGVWSEPFWQIKTGKLNKKWFKENFDDWLPVVNLNFAYIFDKKGNLFYQTHPLLFDCKEIIPEIIKRKNLSFFLKLNKDTILNIAASLINKSEDVEQEGEYVGFIFIGRIIDNERLKEVKKEVREDFEIINLDDDKERVVFLTDYQDKPVIYLKINFSEKSIYKKLGKYITPAWFLTVGCLYALIFLLVKEEKRKIKEEKEKQLVFLGKIMGFIVHELKNPLATIKNCFYLLKEIKDENKRKTYLEIMEKATENITKTIDTFLRISKGEKGEAELVDAKDLVEEIIGKMAIPPYIKIEDSLNNNTKVLANKNQLRYIFKNIIKNSVESIKENGLIKITNEEKDSKVKIIFSDNGCGIKKKDLKKIFEPFYTTKEKGMGFGLSLVKYLLELNNGKIEIFSQEGKGTDVVITLLKGE